MSARCPLSRVDRTFSGFCAARSTGSRGASLEIGLIMAQACKAAREGASVTQASRLPRCADSGHSRQVGLGRFSRTSGQGRRGVA